MRPSRCANTGNDSRRSTAPTVAASRWSGLSASRAARIARRRARLASSTSTGASAVMGALRGPSQSRFARQHLEQRLALLADLLAQLAGLLAFVEQLLGDLQRRQHGHR